MAKTPKTATENTEIADTSVQEPVIVKETIEVEGNSDQKEKLEEESNKDLQKENSESPVPPVDPADQSEIIDGHHTLEKSREEITEYNQEVKKGNIPSDSTDSIDVALEKAKVTKIETNIVDQLAKLESNEDNSVDEPVDHSKWDDYEDEAEDLMDQQNIKEIWRCPVTGYWFSKKVYTEEQEKKTGRSLEHYKN